MAPKGSTLEVPLKDDANDEEKLNEIILTAP